MQSIVWGSWDLKRMKPLGNSPNLGPPWNDHPQNPTKMKSNAEILPTMIPKVSQALSRNGQVSQTYAK